VNDAFFLRVLVCRSVVVREQLAFVVLSWVSQVLVDSKDRFAR